MEQLQRWRSSPTILFSYLLLLLLLCGDNQAHQIVTEQPLPFIVLHGIGDQCANEGVTNFTQVLSDMSGALGYCLAVGNGRSDSYFMHIDRQAELVCETVKSISELQDGYNIVGLSQGNMVARGVIESCHGGPPVHNYVSLGGPHAGVAAVPFCSFNFICRLVNKLIGPVVYTPFVQNHLAPSGYVKIPTTLGVPDVNLRKYYKSASFLPRINNEIPFTRNESLKNRFLNLNHLVLVMFDEDLILIPPQTAWFGYYPDNELGTKILAPNETALYKEDWIGLRALDEAGKVSFINFAGDHLSISDYQMQEFIVPYLRPPEQTVGNMTSPRPLADL